MKQLEYYKEAVKTNPAFKPYIDELVADIEKFRRELDAATGFKVMGCVGKPSLDDADRVADYIETPTRRRPNPRTVGKTG